MKRFRFRLENVLRIRAFELERASAALRLVLDERRVREQRAQATTEALAAGRSLMEAEMQQGADGDRLSMRAAGLAIGRLQVEQAKAAVVELDPVLNEKRRLVQHHRARLRSLERLEEKAQRTYRREAERSEQSELEELARARQARGESNGSPASEMGAR